MKPSTKLIATTSILLIEREATGQKEFNWIITSSQISLNIKRVLPRGRISLRMTKTLISVDMNAMSSNIILQKIMVTAR
jgi:hypothetical protein